jgi:hypothetical protein
MTMKSEATANSVLVASKFENDIHNLLELLGKADAKKVMPGTAYNIYRAASEDEAPAQVGEGELITDAAIKTTVDRTVELTYRKYRNLTGIESIGKYGYEIAVGETGKELLSRAEGDIHAAITAAYGIQATDTAATMQAAAANAWAALNVRMANKRYEPVFFVSPGTAANYLGTADINIQDAFGLKYVQNFMGLGTLIVDPLATDATVWATAKENLDVVAVDLAGIPDMDMMTAADGMCGVHTDAAYSNGAIETVIYSGVSVFPVFSDAVFAVGIGA